MKRTFLQATSEHTTNYTDNKLYDYIAGPTLSRPHLLGESLAARCISEIPSSQLCAVYATLSPYQKGEVLGGGITQFSRED